MGQPMDNPADTLTDDLMRANRGMVHIVAEWMLDRGWTEPLDTEPRHDLDRLERAELVCLMVGWSGGDNTERGKARHELWAAWKRAYEADGGSLFPYDHPELSDERIRELAAQRDSTVAQTMARLSEPVR